LTKNDLSVENCFMQAGLEIISDSKKTRGGFSSAARRIAGMLIGAGLWQPDWRGRLELPRQQVKLSLARAGRAQTRALVG